ncbi:MAG: hypothetical protein IKA47_09225 [Oscillospiraceae bacterium]|nr:hypothetical protein [Oscillospiraceae bacterium]
MIVCIKAITVRFHLTHPAEKQAWEKLLSLRADRHQSFSQAVADAVNAYGAEETHLSRTEKDELVDKITESVTSRLQQMLPAYLAGYSAGANTPVAIAVPQTNTAPSQVATTPTQQENDDAMPDFGDSCMDFDFIGG